MIILNGKLTPEGQIKQTDRTILTALDLEKYIEEVGFLPLFKNAVPGFSVEENTLSSSWWGGNSETDPWEWRNQLENFENITYGKFFNKKAGFISKKWFQYFVATRRDGYDFDSRYEDGLANHRQKKLFDFLQKNGSVSSKSLKLQTGFGKDGDIGFDSSITFLQMHTYIVIKDFSYKLSKNGTPYGRSLTNYCLPEQLWGESFIRGSYEISTSYAKKSIYDNVHKYFPNGIEKSYEKELG